MKILKLTCPGQTWDDWWSWKKEEERYIKTNSFMVYSLKKKLKKRNY